MAPPPKKPFNVLEELKYSPKEKGFSSSGIPLKISRGSRTGKNMYDEEGSRDKNGSILSAQRNNGK
jgi:hypothetical protein